MNLYHRLALRQYDTPYIILLLLLEACLTCLIVLKITYTEIDWTAYMQEVKGYESGERDYVNLRGDTGPLVYPAGFLYLYSWLKGRASAAASTSASEDALVDELDGSTTPEAIERIQWMFAVLYLINCAIVLVLYQKVLQITRQKHQGNATTTASMVWAWRIAMGITCLSKRIHSIFVLRLFNDAPAMLLLYLSIYLFACCDAWSWGCVVFSLAVSIKMNVLLFAPGLLLLLLQKNGCLKGTFGHLSICALVQLVLGWPFLSTYPVSYIKKAFEFDRVFFYKWTVNWKFLDEAFFISKQWAVVLLSCHLGTLVLLAKKWRIVSVSQRGREKSMEWMTWTNPNNNSTKLNPEYIIYTMFVSNFIGIAFARTLHYQFYSWYFHSLPMMHWITNDLSPSSCSVTTYISLVVSILSIIGIEYAFNVYPATAMSSVVLQVSHALLLIKIYSSKVPNVESISKVKKG